MRCFRGHRSLDSITHLFLGGAIAAAIAPAKYRRQALVAGAIINSLPDIDVIPLALFANDPLLNLTWHRAATHSIFVLIPFAVLLWWLLKSRWSLVRENPQRGFWLIFITLLAHPLIDAFTVYGTQIFWPLAVPSTMWSTFFIIDVLFLIVLMLACVLGWVWRDRVRGTRAITWGLGLSLAYLAWSGVAKWRVEAIASDSLAVLGLRDAPRVSTPMPFNTLLWRVVVMTPNGFLEGERSLWADRGPMAFRAYTSDVQAMAAVGKFPATQTLQQFSHGFLKADVLADRLVLSDLRMGAEPDFTFRFAVAEKKNGHWSPLSPPAQLRWPWQASRRLPEVWQRIWSTEAARVVANPSPPQPSP